MFWEKDNDKNNDTQQKDLKVLKTVNNSVELAMLNGILEDNDIPHIVRDHGAGGYMRILAGNSGFFRTDILVHKSAYEEAKEIIEQYGR